MKSYIGAKIIQAEPMDDCSFLGTLKNVETPQESRAGYHVIYPDNYHNWSPKDVFESAYRPISDAERDIIQNKEKGND